MYSNHQHFISRTQFKWSKQHQRQYIVYNVFVPAGWFSNSNLRLQTINEMKKRGFCDVLYVIRQQLADNE